MTVLENVDFSQAKEQGDFEPIPAGEYKLMVENSEMKTASSGSEYLSLKFKVVEGQYKDRYVFANYNLWHNNDEPRRIAIDQFHTACMALAGKPAISIKDTNELHFKTATAIVDIKDDGAYRNNRIKAWVKPVEGAAQSAATTGAPTPPWAKK